jgi:hypothetical protein
MAMAERTRMRPRRGFLTLLAVSALMVSAIDLGAIALFHGAGDDPKDAKKRESGIYVESSETAGKDEPKQLDGSMPLMKPEGLGASMATMGFKKPKMITTLGGDKSGKRVAAGSTFLLVLGTQKSQREMMDNPYGGMTGIPPQASQKDFALLVLALVDGDRVFNSGDGKKIKCAVENVETKVYRFKPEQPLPPGEYAFSWMQGGNASMMWDFGVDGAAK